MNDDEADGSGCAGALPMKVDDDCHGVCVGKEKSGAGIFLEPAA